MRVLEFCILFLFLKIIGAEEVDLHYVVGVKANKESPMQIATFITKTMFLTAYSQNIKRESSLVLPFYFGFLQGDSTNATELAVKVAIPVDDNSMLISDLLVEDEYIRPLSLIMPANHYTRDENYRFLYPRIDTSTDKISANLDYAFLLSPSEKLLNGVYSDNGKAIPGSPLLARANSKRLGVVAIIAKVKSSGCFKITEVGDHMDIIRRYDKHNVVELAAREEIYSQVDYIPEHQFVIPITYGIRTKYLTSSTIVSNNVALTYNPRKDRFEKVISVEFHFRTNVKPFQIADMVVYWNDGLVAMVFKKVLTAQLFPVYGTVLNEHLRTYENRTFYFFLIQQCDQEYYVIGDNAVPKYSLHDERFAYVNFVTEGSEMGSAVGYKEGRKPIVVGIVKGGGDNVGEFEVRSVVEDEWLNEIITATTEEYFQGLSLNDPGPGTTPDEFLSNLWEQCGLLQEHLIETKPILGNIAVKSAQHLLTKVMNNEEPAQRLNRLMKRLSEFFNFNEFLYIPP